MLALHQFPPGGGLMNLSPFCMKVEVFLRLAGLDYRCVDAMPLRTPKGKLPVLHDGVLRVADSEAIVLHLQRAHAAHMPPALREAPRGAQLALRRLVEEDLYFALLWLRWIDATGWRFTSASFFGRLPAPVGSLVGALIRRKMRRDLIGQGTGRHTPGEIAARAIADLDAVEAMLAGEPYFGGAEPGTIDATVYAFLANLLWASIESAPRTHLAAQAPLVAYCERMRDRVGQGPRVPPV